MPRSAATGRVASAARTAAGTRFTNRDFASCLGFNGTTAYVDVANLSSSSIGASDFSISAWVRTTDKVNILTILGTNWSGSLSLELRISAGVVNLLDRSSAGSPLTGVKKVSDGQWHHLVGLRIGTTRYIYIDGALDTSGADNGDNLNGSSRLGLGVNLNSASAAIAATYFIGSIDEIQLYTTGLTLTQVQKLYYEGGTVAGATLIGYWKFDNGSGTSATDSSGGANTGTLSGSTLPTWNTNVVSVARSVVV